MKHTLVIGLMLIGATAFAETFKIDTAASTVAWKAGKKIGSFHEGTIKVKGGEVTTDAKGALTGGSVVVDMKTIANNDLAGDPDSQKKLVGHLSSDDFFKVEKFPESTFKITSVAPKAGAAGEYTVKGDLTMLGKTNAVEFPAKVSGDKKTLTGTATVSVERLKWDLKYGSGSIFKSLTADKIINDSFDLTLNLVAKK